MGADFWIVVQWWGTLFLVGAVAFPLTKRLFGSWYDRGYFFSKAVGMAVVTYAVYLLGMLHLAPFSPTTVFWVLLGIFIAGVGLNAWGKKDKGEKGNWKIIAVEELFFFAALLFWSWVKGHEPSIRGLEKFMDYGFMQSILNSTYFPAPDMWYAGFSINYYYFGHTVVAVLTKLSGLDLAYTFNLMLATIFALTLTMSFSIGKQISHIGRIGRIGQIIGGLLTAWLVTLAGNMQTLYAFTKGYTGEDVQPFWQLLWPVGEFISRLPEGLERYWYANATRFIPFTIHEFPSYSFVVSDVHGHVLSIPFVLLAIALVIQLTVNRKPLTVNRDAVISLAFYGLLVAILLMTNALDGPIYFGLFVVLFLTTNWSNLTPIKSGLTNWTNWKGVGVVVAAAALTSLPFLLHFKSFVSGVAVNCPLALLANRSIGILLFEGVEKCQRSPVWMMYLLWGFFWFCGVWLIMSKVKSQKSKVNNNPEVLLIVFFVFSLLLIIFPEFFYFKDIYPAHFRSNTMFKLGYSAFIMFSIIAGYTITRMIAQRGQEGKRGQKGRILFFLLLVPQLFLVSIYPLFSVRSYFDSLRTYKGLDGTAWIQEQYPDDYGAIMWLKSQVKQGGPSTSLGTIMTGLPVIIEADGDSYTDYARFSAFTGLPTVIGWPVHEWLWRGTYDVVAPRRDDVRMIYESQDPRETGSLLVKYGASFILVGTLERQKYPALIEEKFAELGDVVFSSGDTKIYAIDPDKVGVDKDQQ